jgi:hypothetical protein
MNSFHDLTLRFNRSHAHPDSTREIWCRLFPEPRKTSIVSSIQIEKTQESLIPLLPYSFCSSPYDKAFAQTSSHLTAVSGNPATGSTPNG